MAKKQFKINNADTLKFVAATLTGAAVLVSTVAPAGAEEITPVPSTNGEDNVTGTPVVNATTTTPETATISYDRQDAYDTQDNVFPSESEQQEFIQHVVENKPAVTVTDKEQLSNVVSEAIKNNDAVIVIEDANDVLGDIALGGDNVITEIQKTGTNAGALVSGYGLTTMINKQGESVWVLMPYYEETNALASAKDQYIEQVATYVNTNFSTEIEKLQAIYSFLGETTVYNENTKTPSSSPAALILENQAVCEAFAYLYNDIATKSGINMRYVTGVADGGNGAIGHAWNLVELNGEWYNTDATWGNMDRNGENSLETNMSFFLFSDAKAQNTHQRTESPTEFLPAATDTTYDVLYNNEHQYAFGGGLTGNLIVSPNTNEIVVFDTTTNALSGVSIPTETTDYQIITSALVGADLFVTYFDKANGAIKVGTIDLGTGTLTAVYEGGMNGYADVKYTKDGVFVGDTLVQAVTADSKVISHDLTVDVTIGNDHNFALQTAYAEYVVEFDNKVINTINDYYATNYSPTADATEFIDGLSSTINKIKDADVKAAQMSKLTNHANFLAIANTVAGLTTIENEAVIENLQRDANLIADEALKQQALALIDAKITELTPPNTDGEGEEEPTPTEPTEPAPVEPTPTEPTEPTPVEPTPTEPTEPTPVEPTPTEPTNPAPVEPTPTEPTEPAPVEPTPTEPTEPAPVEPTPTEPTQPAPVEPTPTTPTQPAPVEPTPTTPTQPAPVAPTPTVPTPTDTVVTPPVEVPTETPSVNKELLESIKLDLPIGLVEGSVAVTINEETGNLVISSTELSNTTAVTITIPVVAENANKVLKIRTANGLEAVPYTIKDGQIIVQLHKAGELVFVDAAASLTDIANNQFRSDIEKLAERGIFTGDNGNFNPNSNMTRAQFAGTLVRALGLNESSTTGFADINSSAWYAGSVGALADLGLMNGDNGAFNPGGEVTRQQLFAVVGKILEAKGITASSDLTSDYKDAGKVSDYAKPYVSVLIEIGAVSGDNGTLKPQDRVTKGQMAKVLSKVLEKIEAL